MIDQRASGSARRAAGAAESRFPRASCTSASRCSECASPAGSRGRGAGRRPRAAHAPRGRGRRRAAPPRRAARWRRRPRAAPRPAPRWPAGGRQLEHLGVRGGAVEQVLGHAQVRVEDPDRELRPAGPPLQLAAQALEPLPAVVGEEALQRDEVEQLPVGRPVSASRRRASATAPTAAAKSRGGRQVAAGEQDRRVVGAAVELQPVEGGLGRLQVAGHVPPAPQPAGPRRRVGPGAERLPERARAPGSPPAPSRSARSTSTRQVGAGGVVPAARGSPARRGTRQRGLRLGRPEDEGTAAPRPRPNEVVGDRAGERGRPLRAAAARRCADRRRCGPAAEQRLPHQRVAEPYPSPVRRSAPSAGPGPAARTRLLGPPGQGDELVGVEDRAEHATEARPPEWRRQPRRPRRGGAGRRRPGPSPPRRTAAPGPAHTPSRVGGSALGRTGGQRRGVRGAERGGRAYGHAPPEQARPTSSSTPAGTAGAAPAAPARSAARAR